MDASGGAVLITTSPPNVDSSSCKIESLSLTDSSDGSHLSNATNILFVQMYSTRSGLIYVRTMVFIHQIQNRITYSLVAATDNLLGSITLVLGAHRAERGTKRREQDDLATVPDCSKPFCCSRPQKKEEGDA